MQWYPARRRDAVAAHQISDWKQAISSAQRTHSGTTHQVQVDGTSEHIDRGRSRNRGHVADSAGVAKERGAGAIQLNANGIPINID